MVAGNQDFVTVGQFREPQVQILQLFQSADAQAVAGVDQQVAVRYLIWRCMLWVSEMQTILMVLTVPISGIRAFLLNLR